MAMQDGKHEGFVIEIKGSDGRWSDDLGVIQRGSNIFYTEAEAEAAANAIKRRYHGEVRVSPVWL